MGDKVFDDVLDFRAVDVKLEQGVAYGGLLGTLVGLLAGRYLPINPQAVLEIVNAERGGLVEADGAQVAGDFEPARVRFLNRGAQLGAGDVHVRLEIMRALLGPVGDGAARVVGVLERGAAVRCGPDGIPVAVAGRHPVVRLTPDAGQPLLIAAVRLAGVYAMAGLADDWPENRQTCVDVLCGYLRMPYEPDPGDEAPGPERLAFRAGPEVRHTAIRAWNAASKGGTSC